MGQQRAPVPAIGFGPRDSPKLIACLRHDGYAPDNHPATREKKIYLRTSTRVTLEVTSVWMISRAGAITIGDRIMNTSNGDPSQRTPWAATIHPIAARPAERNFDPMRGGNGKAGGMDPTTPTTRRLVLTVDEAAYLLNISRSFAYELVARGELPALRLGRRIVIPRIPLEELLGTAIR